MLVKQSYIWSFISGVRGTGVTSDTTRSSRCRGYRYKAIKIRETDQIKQLDHIFGIAD